MPETVEVNAKITNVDPLMPIKVKMEIQKLDKPDEFDIQEFVVFIDQKSENIYDAMGKPIDEDFKKAIEGWLEQAQQKMMGNIASATPEQLATMGNFYEKSPGGLIIPK